MGLPLAALVRRRAFLLAVALVSSYAYFYEGGGWNQNTRFDLVRALVERHTLQIDLYDDNTLDKAVLDGHVYADKAPGASFTAVPAVWLARAILAVTRADLYSPEAITELSYVATVAAAGVPAAIASVCVFGVVRRIGGSDAAALVAALACGLGTPLWAYATLLYGHALAAGCLALAFWASVRLGDDVDRSSVAVRYGLTLGASAGWAVVTEFPASIPAAAIVLFGWWRTRTVRADALMPVVASSIAGLAAAAVVLLAYNWFAFGSAFHIGYSSEPGYEGMRTGIFGVNWPNPRVALALLFGRYRGLIPLAPALLAAPFGFWVALRDARSRAIGAVALGVAAYYFLLTAGYAYWDGGWSYGSRHLGPALPFACVGVGAAWRSAGRFGRAVILALTIVGIGESLVAVSTTPQPPGGAAAPRDPMRELLWPAFVSGDFPIGWQSVLELRAPGGPMSDLERRGVPRASWNVGQRLGLKGHLSLVPLFAIWTIAFIGWRRLSAAILAYESR